MSDFKLTPDEERALARLEEKYEDIRNLTELVATGYSTGFYCHGWGGIGKSYNVLKTLADKGHKYILMNTKLTAPGFAKSLEKNNRGLFVVEDIENVFDEKPALNLLRSALWGQRDEKTGRMARPIVYTTGHENWNFDFEFEGAILATGNRPLGDIPELQAVKTRIEVYKLETERDEVLAVGKKIALGGFKSDKGLLPPHKCLEIFEFFRANLPATKPPDLRILDRAYNRHLGLQALGKIDRWQRLLLSGINESSQVTVETPAFRLANVDAIAADLRSKHGTDFRRILPEWSKLTSGFGKSGKSLGKTAYYDALERIDKRRP